MSLPVKSARTWRTFWRLRSLNEMDDEIAGHIELQVQRFMREGMAREAAERAAASRFGNTALIREELSNIHSQMESRVRRSDYLTDLRQDLRFATRALRRSPLFTTVGLLTIAVGIGANTAIFSVVHAVLLESQPYAFANRDVVISHLYQSSSPVRNPLSAPELFDLRESLHSAESIAAIRPSSVVVTGDDARPEQLDAYTVTPNLFHVLGAPARIGRTFHQSEGAPGGARVVVLSDALWKRRFGSDSSILGKSIIINALPREIIGVMPEGIRFPDDALGYAKAPASLWMPSTYEQFRTPDDRGNQNLIVIARLTDVASVESINADLAVVSARYRQLYPDRYNSDATGQWRFAAVSLNDETVGEVRPLLGLFSGAVALVLLIACVNVATLLFARGAVRTREMALRLALGATRARLVRQLLVESLTMAIGGGMLGVAIAWCGIRVCVMLQPGNIPRLSHVSLNLTVLLFALGISIVTGLLVGLVPAIQQSGTGLAGAIADGSRGGDSVQGNRRLRALLVSVQIAMALVLLNGAGSLGRSLSGLQHVDFGFRAEGVLSMYVSLPRASYDSASKVADFFEQLDAGVSAIPAVTDASGIYPLPMSGEGWSGSFSIVGNINDAKDPPYAEFAASMPRYLKTMQIAVLQGRDFTNDDRAGTAGVVIVDELLAHRYWPGENAIGRRIKKNAGDSTSFEVIGVVKHVENKAAGRPGGPQLYWAYLQRPQGMLYAVARSNSSSLPQAEAYRKLFGQSVRALDKQIPVSKMSSLSELAKAGLARQRFNMTLIGALAGVALLLASVGLYGVMSFMVSQRTREIGIRMALGGQPGAVRWMMFRESLWISLSGLAVGTVLSFAISGAVQRFLFNVKAGDPATYAAIATLLLVVASLAAFGPANRATRVSPVSALRE